MSEPLLSLRDLSVTFHSNSVQTRAVRNLSLDIAAGEANFCESTGQPNWCDEKDACHGDEKARCSRKKWCVCQWAFDKVLQRTPCSELKLDCAATNMKALEAFKRDPQKYSKALECISKKCAVGVGLKPD